jgi:tartrate dehydratase beta subunit/fumarate hydratase class I family protein
MNVKVLACKPCKEFIFLRGKKDRIGRNARMFFTRDHSHGQILEKMNGNEIPKGFHSKTAYYKYLSSHADV